MGFPFSVVLVVVLLFFFGRSGHVTRFTYKMYKYRGANKKHTKKMAKRIFLIGTLVVIVILPNMADLRRVIFKCCSE